MRKYSKHTIEKTLDFEVVLLVFTVVVVTTAAAVTLYIAIPLVNHKEMTFQRVFCEFHFLCTTER